MADSQDAPGKLKLSKLAEAALITSIIEDCLQTVIHAEVLNAHRGEKLLRMASAAVIAESAAIAKTSSDNFSLPSVSNSKPQATTPNPQSIKTETAGAIYDHGRILLKGNPLKTTPDLLCGKCRLPRLRYPITGEGSKMPDLSKQYCTLHPFVIKSQHDIYGNPFPIDQPKTKKERENLKRLEKEAQNNREGTVGSQDGSGDLRALAPGGKAASYVPWHTCPNCKRSLLITRFAQHAEKCLGIAGRASSRNAMAKMTNGGTPSINGSRVGTPTPASQENEASDKKKKKSSYVKKADRERLAQQGLMPAPKLRKGSAANGAGESDASPQKREREADNDEKPRKKLKLSIGRRDSEASISRASADGDGDDDDDDG